MGLLPILKVSVKLARANMMLLIGLLRNVEDCLRANMMLLIGLLHDVEDCLLQKWAACILYQLSLDLSTKFPQVFLGPDQLSPWNSRPEDLLISSLCVIFRFSFKKILFCSQRLLAVVTVQALCSLLSTYSTSVLIFVFFGHTMQHVGS